MISDHCNIWLALAELFFLDTEPQDYDYTSVAQRLKEAGWSREQARTTLIELIAPVAGINLGYLIYPVIGGWSGFDKDDLCARIAHRETLRRRYPKWYFWLQDRYARWMLKHLQINRLLDLLA